MKDTASSSERKWSHSFRRLSAVLVDGLECRLALLALEFQEEKQRLLGGLILALAAAFAAFLGFLCLNLLLVLLFWETHRIPVVILMCGFYIAAALFTGAWLRHRLRTEPDPFSTSLGELQKDLSFLKGDKE